MTIVVFRNLANTAEGVKSCHWIEWLNRICYWKNYKNSQIYCCESFGHLSSLFRPISLLYLSQKCLSSWKTRDQSDGRDLVIKTDKEGPKDGKINTKQLQWNKNIYLNQNGVNIFKIIIWWSYDEHLMIIWWGYNDDDDISLGVIWGFPLKCNGLDLAPGPRRHHQSHYHMHCLICHHPKPLSPTYII